MSERTWNEDARSARKLLAEDGPFTPEARAHGLRVAYEHYIAHAPWVPFERFELGLQILADSVCDAPPDTEQRGE